MDEVALVVLQGPHDENRTSEAFPTSSSPREGPEAKVWRVRCWVRPVDNFLEPKKAFIRSSIEHAPLYAVEFSAATVLVVGAKVLDADEIFRDGAALSILVQQYPLEPRSAAATREEQCPAIVIGWASIVEGLTEELVVLPVELLAILGCISFSFSQQEILAYLWSSIGHLCRLGSALYQCEGT